MKDKSKVLKTYGYLFDKLLFVVFNVNPCFAYMRSRSLLRRLHH